MKNNLFTLICILVMGIFYSCNQEDYMLYDTGKKDALYIEYKNSKNLLVDTMSYSYGFDWATEYTFSIPVKVQGMPADFDRKIVLEPVADTDMVLGIHYTINEEDLYIRKNEVATSVRVTLLRENDLALKSREFTLTLGLKTSAEFDTVGQSTLTILYSDIEPEFRPEWWADDLYDIPKYRYDLIQHFFRLFYATADLNPVVYNEMIGRYGEFFINAAKMQGPFAMYENYLARYVLLPMYEYYEENDPQVLEGWDKPKLY